MEPPTHSSQSNCPKMALNAAAFKEGELVGTSQKLTITNAQGLVSYFKRKCQNTSLLKLTCSIGTRNILPGTVVYTYKPITLEGAGRKSRSS